MIFKKLNGIIKRLEPSTIAGKILIPIVVVLLLGLLLVVLSSHVRNQVTDTVQSIHYEAEKQAAAGNLRFYSSRMPHAVIGHLATGNEAHISSFLTYQEKSELAYVSLMNLDPDDYELDLILKIRSTLDSIDKLGQMIFEADGSDLSLSDEEQAIHQITELSEQIHYLSTGIFDHIHHKTIELNEEFRQLQSRGEILVNVSVAAAIVLSLLIFYLVLLYVVKPIRLISESTDSVAAGDFSQRVPVHSDDEIGSLARSFNSMAKTIGHQIDHIKSEKEFIQLLYKLSSIDHSSDSVDEILSVALENVCEYFYLQAGHVYLNKDGQLISSRQWHINDSKQSKLFEKMLTEGADSPCFKIVNEVFRTGTSADSESLNQTVELNRISDEVEAPVHTCIAVPLLVEREVLGVMVFLSNRAMQIDDQTRLKLNTIGIQIGRVLERVQAEKIILRSEARFKALFDHSNDTILITDDKEWMDCNVKAVEALHCGCNRTDEGPIENFFLRQSKRTEEEKARLEKYLNIIRSGEPVHFEWIFKNKERQTIHAEVDMIPIQLPDEELIQITIRDITERVESAEQIRNSLKEKEILLQEIHHRVKNNLALISGLLELQKDTTVDPEAIEALRHSQARIKSIAQVHELLYGMEDLATIKLDQYTRELSSFIELMLTNPEKQIDLIIEAEPVILTLEQAVPYGLLLNELLTNAYKHAFKNQKKGEIRIQLRERDDIISVVISDDGHGIDESVNFDDSESLGMTLIQTLTEQLQANLKHEANNGTTFYLEFRNMTDKTTGKGFQGYQTTK